MLSGMDFQPVERASKAFQQSLTAEEIGKVCRRAFGDATMLVSGPTPRIYFTR